VSDSSSTALVRCEPALSESERVALVGFLAGYRGQPRVAYTLDPRQFTEWCVQYGRHLFDVRRIDIECFARALWVTDLTYVPTRAGMAYVCFIVDAFSRTIVGWRVAANMKTSGPYHWGHRVDPSGGLRNQTTEPPPDPGRFKLERHHLVRADRPFSAPRSVTAVGASDDGSERRHSAPVSCQ
jgi:hypothetical protein